MHFFSIKSKYQSKKFMHICKTVDARAKAIWLRFTAKRQLDAVQKIFFLQYVQLKRYVFVFTPLKLKN